MAKQRMVAGYKFEREGVIAPGEPVKGKVTVPDNATILCIRIDPRGDFVLFCEVWSHPEGTQVNFREETWTIVPSNVVLPAGSWEWFETLPVGPAIMHVYRKTVPALEIAG